MIRKIYKLICLRLDIKIAVAKAELSTNKKLCTCLPILKEWGVTEPDEVKSRDITDPTWEDDEVFKPLPEPIFSPPPPPRKKSLVELSSFIDEQYKKKGRRSYAHIENVKFMERCWGKTFTKKEVCDEIFNKLRGAKYSVRGGGVALLTDSLKAPELPPKCFRKEFLLARNRLNMRSTWKGKRKQKPTSFPLIRSPH